MSYDIKIISSLKNIASEQWYLEDDLLPISMNLQYLLMLEQEHCHDIEFSYGLIYSNNQLVGIICFQLINFKGAYVKNFFRTEVKRGFFKNLFLDVFYRLLDRLSWRLLTSGNIYFTGDNGIYLSESISIEDGAKLIDACFKKAHQESKNKVTAYMVNNVYDNPKEAVHLYLEQQRYATYPVDPDMFMKIDSQWENLEDYKRSLTSKYRVRLKKVYKDSTLLKVKRLSNGEIHAENETLFQLYMNTAKKVDLNLGYLCKDYFLNMSKLWGDKFFIMAYSLKDEIIGFMSILIDNIDLDINYMGLDYTVNRQYKLYNRMLLDLVELGIDLKVKTMHLGRTATEMKSTIGAISIPMHIYLSSPNSIVDKGMRFFEPYFGSPSYTLRKPFKN